jgi:hypothetical protein
LIWVDILATGKIVYSGFVFDFEYSGSKDQLETITLKNALKRTYLKPEESETKEPINQLKLETPRPIQGDAFLILAKDIININLSYLKVEGDVSKPEPQVPTDM